MLVDDRAVSKMQLRTCRDHRAGEVHQLTEIERSHRACHHKHRQLDARIPMMHDIGKDGVESAAVEPGAAQFVPHQINARRRYCQGGADR